MQYKPHRIFPGVEEIGSQLEVRSCNPEHCGDTRSRGGTERWAGGRGVAFAC